MINEGKTLPGFPKWCLEDSDDIVMIIEGFLLVVSNHLPSGILVNVIVNSSIYRE